MNKMKEFRSLGVIMAIATLAALIFVAIWAYNNHSDLGKRIDQLNTNQHGIIEFLKKSEQDVNSLKTGLTELTEVVKIQQHQLKKFDSRYVISALQAIEQSIKTTDSSFSLPPMKRRTRRNRKYDSDNEESDSGSDSDLENEIKRRKETRRRVK